MLKIFPWIPQKLHFSGWHLTLLHWQYNKKRIMLLMKILQPLAQFNYSDKYNGAINKTQ